MRDGDIRIKMTFAEESGPTELEVSTPIHSEASFRMWAAFASLRVNPISVYLVRSDARLIAHVKLTECDGSPLAHDRAAGVMNLLEQRLFGPNDGEAGAPPHLDSGGAGERAA